MRFRAPFLLLCLAASLTVLLAGAEIVLEDGQVLEAANVKRDGEVYIIELKSGGLLTIPVDLIKKVRVTGDDVPRQVAGEAPPPGPSGIRHGEPVTVAGEPVRPPRTSEQVEALDVLDALAAREDIRLDMDLSPGDMQFLHNHQILHARGAFKDYPEPERRRHLLRLWLAPPKGRPLPPAFAERYGSIDVGTRRGGITVSGMQLQVPFDPE